MLQGNATKRGAGLTLIGDYDDLSDLRKTVHYIASDDGPISSNHQEFVLALAYDLRKAYEGQRNIETVRHSAGNSTYFSVDILLPTVLVQVGMLRSAAAYLPTDKASQANLYRLEACVENALNQLDAKIMRECCTRLREFSPLGDDYLIGFVDYKAQEYVLSAKTAKGRSSKLPSVMGDMSEYSNAYQNYKPEILKVAQEGGCDPHSVVDLSEWPDFNW